MKKIQKIIIGIGILALTLSLSSSLVMAKVVGVGKNCTTDTCSQGLKCNSSKICEATSYTSVDCAGDENTKADSVLCKVLSTLSIVFALALVLAVLYFVWGVVQYVTAGGDEEKSAAGKKTMMFGIIALVVIATVAGLMSIITNYMNIDNAIKLPFIG